MIVEETDRARHIAVNQRLVALFAGVSKSGQVSDSAFAKDNKVSTHVLVQRNFAI